MVIDPLKVHPKEAAKDYSLVKALVKYLEQERIALHRIAKAQSKIGRWCEDQFGIPDWNPL